MRCNYERYSSTRLLVRFFRDSTPSTHKIQVFKRVSISERLWYYLASFLSVFLLTTVVCIVVCCFLKSEFLYLYNYEPKVGLHTESTVFIQYNMSSSNCLEILQVRALFNVNEFIYPYAHQQLFLQTSLYIYTIFIVADLDSISEGLRMDLGHDG